MPRAIIYPHKVAALERGRRDREPLYGAGPTGDAGPVIPPDAFLERVAKHVPAEVLAAYLLVNSFDLSHTWRWIFFALFIAAAPIVDQWTADRVKARKLRPRGWIYALFAVIAFVAWALATSGATRQLIGIKLQPATGLMVLVSLLLGAVDDRVSGLLDRPAPGAREREARPPG